MGGLTGAVCAHPFAPPSPTPPPPQSDSEFLEALTRGDDLARDAAREVAAALPEILTLVAQAHSAVGRGDPHVRATIGALFAPRPGQSVRAAVHEALSSPAAAGAPGGAAAAVAGLVDAVLRLCVEFEAPGASVALRGSPLAAAACEVLRRMARLRGLPVPPLPGAPGDGVAVAVGAGDGARDEGGGGDDGGGAAGAGPPASGEGDPAPVVGTSLPDGADGGQQVASFEGGVDLLRAGSTDSARPPPASGSATLGVPPARILAVRLPGEGSGDSAGNGEAPAAGVNGGAPPATNAAAAAATTRDGGLTTRSVAGILRLLALPCEGSGRLDGGAALGGHAAPDAAGGGGDAFAYLFGPPLGSWERLETLRECARRVFYLLTMRADSSRLAVGEAERRVAFFAGSLYMRQLPVARDVLALPAFNVGAWGGGGRWRGWSGGGAHLGFGGARCRGRAHPPAAYFHCPPAPARHPPAPPAVTPVYAETIIFDRGYLTSPTPEGSSPMVYLKAMYAPEW